MSNLTSNPTMLANLEADLKSANEKIMSLTKFEMPYQLEVAMLYERQTPKGFSDDLKMYAMKKICTGFAGKRNIADVSDFVLDSMKAKVGGNWLCLIVPTKALNGISLHCDGKYLKLGFKRNGI